MSFGGRGLTWMSSKCSGVSLGYDGVNMNVLEASQQRKTSSRVVQACCKSLTSL